MLPQDHHAEVGALIVSLRMRAPRRRIVPASMCRGWLIPALLWFATPLAAQTSLSPAELHDAIVEVIRTNATRPVVSGDTFVAWSPRPVLYSTVRRTGSRVESSLIRNDAMVGTAETDWAEGRPRKVHVKWTQRDSVLLERTFTVAAETIQSDAPEFGRRDVPAIPWAIADYGMEDQLLPLIAAVPTDDRPHPILVYRPFPARWDSIAVTSVRHRGWLRITLSGADKEQFFWVIGHAGALIRITRSVHTDDERVPLLLSPGWGEYTEFLRDSL